MADEDVAESMRHLLAGNAQRAEELLLIAAQQGSGIAAHNLGVMYLTGAPGVEANIEEARKWLERSWESGFEASVASDSLWFKRTSC